MSDKRLSEDDRESITKYMTIKSGLNSMQKWLDQFDTGNEIDVMILSTFVQIFSSFVSNLKIIYKEKDKISSKDLLKIMIEELERASIEWRKKLK